MSTKVRPTVLALAVGLVLLSVLAVVARRSRSAGPQAPQASASQSVSPNAEQGTGGTDVSGPVVIPSGAGGGSKTVVRRPAPRATKVILKDGQVVPAREGRASLSDPGVMAVVYEGAPPAAVQRLKEILESGSNEYPDFTSSEKYPPWVYDKIREMLPGKLGEIIARMAKMESEAPLEERAFGGPALDLSNLEETGYDTMYLISDQAKQSFTQRGTPADTNLVADTRFGTVVASEAGIHTAAQVAVWLAHRLAAGDSKIRLPRIPPKTFPDWESWVRSFSTEEYARQLEDEGLLPKRSAR